MKPTHALSTNMRQSSNNISSPDPSVYLPLLFNLPLMAGYYLEELNACPPAKECPYMWITSF